MNYKPHGYAEVGRDIVHHVYASDVKVLYFLHNSVNAAKSLQLNGSPYQVPTGRKFVILVLSLQHSNTGASVALSHGSTVDVEDVILFIWPFSGTKLYEGRTLNLVATAGNYITVDPNGTSLVSADVVGYEVDI